MQSSDVPSDFNLTSFSLWFSLSEAEERREEESLYVLVHRLVQLFLEFGLRDDGSYLHDRASQMDVTDASMDEVATVSNGFDRGRVYMEEQTILLRHDNNGVNVGIPSAEQSIIVHEQGQPPWVPSPRRLGLCSYKDTEAQARVLPLARAEEDSLTSFGIGGEAHGHMKRKVRRTIRRFFMNGQTYHRSHHIVTGTQLAAFFGQASVQRVWIPAREAQRIEKQQRRKRHRRYWQALAGDILSVSRWRSSSVLRTCCYSLASGNSPAEDECAVTSSPWPVELDSHQHDRQIHTGGGTSGH